MFQTLQPPQSWRWYIAEDNSTNIHSVKLGVEAMKVELNMVTNTDSVSGPRVNVGNAPPTTTIISCMCQNTT